MFQKIQSPTSIELKKTGQPGRVNSFDRISILFIGIVIAITALNILWPHRFFIFGIQHLSYLSLWECISLTAAVVILITLLGYGWIIRRKWWLIATAALFVTSFFVFNTEYPEIHGDGEAGASPNVPTLLTYPGGNGRLQSFLAYGFTKIVPYCISFRYYRGALEAQATPQYRHVNSSWILFTNVAGIFIVLLVSSVILVSQLSTPAKLGLQLTILTAEPILNAYGHFDSYIVPVACCVCWILAVWWIHFRPATWYTYVALGLTLIFAAWAHPVLAILLGYSGLLIGMFVLKRFKFVLPLWILILGAILYGLVPFIAGHGNLDFFKPAQPSIIGWLIHEKFMSMLQVSLPAWLLLILLLYKRRKVFDCSQPILALSIFILISTGLLFFTLGVGYGLYDEFLYSILGVLVLGAVVFLFLKTTNNDRLILYVGALSLFLFIPKMCVYSNRLILDRFGQNILYDPCPANRYYSPYGLFAMKIPIETKMQRNYRLSYLYDGVENPLPMWKSKKEVNRFVYIAWCFEFDEIKRGTEQLLLVIGRNNNWTKAIPLLWVDDAFCTARYHNQSRWISRWITQQLIRKKLAIEPDNPIWLHLSNNLNQLDKTAPIPSFYTNNENYRIEYEALPITGPVVPLGIPALEGYFVLVSLLAQRIQMVSDALK